MTSTRASKLTFAVLSTAILMAVIAVLLFATPNGAFAAEPERPTDLVATAVDHDTVSLTWSHPDPTTVDHYQVLSRTIGAGTRLSSKSARPQPHHSSTTAWSPNPRTSTGSSPSTPRASKANAQHEQKPPRLPRTRRHRQSNPHQRRTPRRPRLSGAMTRGRTT